MQFRTRRLSHFDHFAGRAQFQRQINRVGLEALDFDRGDFRAPESLRRALKAVGTGSDAIENVAPGGISRCRRHSVRAVLGQGDRSIGDSRLLRVQDGARHRARCGL